MNECWRLEHLVQLAGQALSAAPYEGQTSGRVRNVPDARTIRYYSTIGVLDRPLEMRGRTAYYGRRHLLQIVAVKRLQARGMSLVNIQKNVAGADNSSLERWAALPAGFWEVALKRQTATEPPSLPDELLASVPQMQAAGGRTRFWATEPALTEIEDRA
jgi:DNA-binding transcriptional MerR regulator